MSKTEEANQIIMKHVIWSLGAGLIPLPLFDITAVTAIQVDMLTQLGNLYGTDITKSAGKTLVSALAGSTAAKLGASALKALPGVGTIIGGVSMSVMSGASTYAVGQVAISYLEENGELIGIDMEWAKKAYNEAFEKGKKVVSNLKDKAEESEDVFKALEKLGKLRDQGVISEEEFEEKKQALLDQI